MVGVICEDILHKIFQMVWGQVSWVRLPATPLQLPLTPTGSATSRPWSCSTPWRGESSLVSRLSHSTSGAVPALWPAMRGYSTPPSPPPPGPPTSTGWTWPPAPTCTQTATSMLLSRPGRPRYRARYSRITPGNLTSASAINFTTLSYRAEIYYQTLNIMTITQAEKYDVRQYIYYH